jgi:hypothetical protein
MELRWVVIAFDVLLSATHWVGTMSRRPDVFFDIRHSIANLARSLAGNALNSPLL